MATTGVLLVSGAALAADLPTSERNASTVTAAELRVPPMNRFEGAFVGLSFGGGKSAAIKASGGRVKGETFVLGNVRAGYNWQNGPLVLGVEAGVSPAFGGRKSSDKAGSGFGFADARLKLGLASDRAMVYGFGGVALLQATYTDAPFNAGRNASFNDMSKPERQSLIASGGKTYNRSQFKTGLIVGAGAEYALDDNWSVRAEAAHISVRGVASAGKGAGKKGRAGENIVLVGLNYRF